MIVDLKIYFFSDCTRLQCFQQF